MKPGEYFLESADIHANLDRELVELKVSNSGDRPVQIGSHFHFFEVNRCLKFDREKAYGMRLNIPSGTAVRFEPGQSHTVELCSLAGKRTIHGFNRLVEGFLDDPEVRKKALEKMKKFCDGE
jgi:urease subunit gamma/beta